MDLDPKALEKAVEAGRCAMGSILARDIENAIRAYLADHATVPAPAHALDPVRDPEWLRFIAPHWTGHAGWVDKILDLADRISALAPAPAPDDKWSKRRSDGHWRTDAQEAKANAALAPAPAPGGCVTVPRVPTDAMTIAGSEAYEEDAFGNRTAWPSDVWRAMVNAALAAAPAPGVREYRTFDYINRPEQLEAYVQERIADAVPPPEPIAVCSRCGNVYRFAPAPAPEGE